MSKQISIGIVGGGQLGKMLTIAAKKMGFYVVISDPTPQSPAGQVADKQLIGDYKDEKITRELARLCDVITVDAEFVNDEVLLRLEKKGEKIYPSPTIITIIKDKLLQKQFLKKNNIPTTQFLSIHSKEDILNAVKKLGYPIVLKARFDAYDGKGNFVIRKVSDIDKGLEKLKERKLYVEKYIPFKKELAIMIARNIKGNIAIYPVVETIHKDNICDTVIAPASVSKQTQKKAQALARKVMKQFKGIGVFGIEMFLKKDNNILVNEIAPRVHNSGHYTIEACITSQFEQHIRAIAILPLGSTQMIVKKAVMKNILGEKEGAGFPNGVEKALRIDNVSLHVYGKRNSRPQRKMGHITVVGDNLKECLKRVNLARKALII